MPNIENTKVLMIEKNASVTELIKSALESRGYSVTVEPKADKAMTFLKESPPPLAFLGESEEGLPPLELMRSVVMQSPMTSLILISTYSEEELHERAEGYGILGSVNPNRPKDQLQTLLDTFENIYKALRPAH